MHGKGQRGSELCRRLIGGQHMPVTTTTTVAVGDSSVVSTITADSFCKVLPWWVFPIFSSTSLTDCFLFRFFDCACTVYSFLLISSVSPSLTKRITSIYSILFHGLWKPSSVAGWSPVVLAMMCVLDSPVPVFFLYIFPSQVFWEMDILVTWDGNCFKISSFYPAKFNVALHGWV